MLLVCISPKGRIFLVDETSMDLDCLDGYKESFNGLLAIYSLMRIIDHKYSNLEFNREQMINILILIRDTF